MLDESLFVTFAWLTECLATLLALPLTIPSLCVLVVHAWLLTIGSSKCPKLRVWFCDDPRNDTFSNTSTHFGSVLLVSPASSLNICMNPVSPVHRLSLSLYPFCPLHFVLGWQPWNTASFPQLFSREPQMKRYCQPFLSTAPHKCWQETTIPSLTFYGNSEHTLPIKDEAFESAESEMMWRNLMTHNVVSILAVHSQTTRCTICPSGELEWPSKLWSARERVCILVVCSK